MMDVTQVDALAAWLIASGLEGRDEPALLAGFCERARAAGLPLGRAAMIVDTLHPIHEGRVFAWYASEARVKQSEYGSSDEGDAAQVWRRSPFYRLISTGDSRLRRRLLPETDSEFAIFPDLRAQGFTDYLALIYGFAAPETSQDVVGGMERLYSSWVADAPDGFRDADLSALDRLVPLLALAVKSASLARIAGTLVETYLGRDAGRRVLSGRIARGVADTIEAVLWFSDLRGYTRLADAAAPGQIIPLLNDYAEAVVTAIHDRGGDVLKFMGDGVLAIFPCGGALERNAACRAALDAAAEARRAVAALNGRRAAEGEPTADVYLGLHLGEVFYGNIGSTARLDFTVVGPAVNEVSRIAALCRSVEQPLLLSSAFAAALRESGTAPPLVSVGRYALRGVSRPQDLWTEEPQG